jgi:hypothetical protein
MHVTQTNPRYPFRPRHGRVSRVHDIVEALKHNPAGAWFAATLSELSGETAKLKLTATTRAVRRFYDVQTLIEDDRFFVRRLPDRMGSHRLPVPTITISSRTA